MTTRLQGGESAERLLKAATDAAPASLQPVLASVAARIKTKPTDVDTDDDDASESVAAEGWVIESCRFNSSAAEGCVMRSCRVSHALLVDAAIAQQQLAQLPHDTTGSTAHSAGRDVGLRHATLALWRRRSGQVKPVIVPFS